MAKKDYAAMADGVIKAVGGEGNIANVTHCMTRLRLQLVDNSKLNEEEAKKVPGVMNLIVQNGEYQFVIGQDVPSLYEEMVKHDGIKAGGSVDDIEAAKSDNKKKGKIMDAIFSFIGGTFSTLYSGTGCRRSYRCRADTAYQFLRCNSRFRYLSGILCH